MKKNLIPIISLLFVISCSWANVDKHSADKRQPAAIATAHPLATEAGEKILAQGGNAFDAAVAISAALAVVEPYSSGIGGGGFWLLHREKDGFQTMLDGRETAPLNAHRDMYLDAEGKVIAGASMNGPLAAGIPGVVAALEQLSAEYGNLSLRQSLQPAIDYARNGFAVDEHYRRMAGFRLQALRASDDAAKIFLRNNEVPDVGVMIQQPDLANTLSVIAEQGAAGFYQGEVAEKLLAAVQQHGGIWQQKDFDQYRVLQRKPLSGQYHEMKITSVTPPSSGGVAMLQILNQLETLPFKNLADADSVHYLIESMRRAYRDRAQFLGDSDFVEVPLKRLTGKQYAAGLAASIHPDKAMPSELLPGVVHDNNSRDTTHFSVIDHQGNRVAATLSINYPFGSGFVAAGTGVLLNDEMDDFSAKPGVPNAYGLVGAEANAIAPGKRMLSSMTPTFLETPQRIAVIGSPGGSRIITMVLLGSLQFYAGDDAQSIVNTPRLHHQYLPDRVFYEADAFNEIMIDQLMAAGHELQQADNPWGNMQLVIWDKQTGKISAASDVRGVGRSVVVE